MKLAALVLAVLLGVVPTTSKAFGLLGVGGPIIAGSYTGACDTIASGCAAAYSTSQSLVAAYSGPMFELVQQAPVWTGTGYISGTAFTVSSTSTGALSIGLALSSAGSGTTPALTPITYITGGSGPYTVNNSQTAGSSGSPLTMAAYSVYDVPQSSHTANLSGIPAFCKGETCLWLKVFNEASTGTVNDILASNIHGGGQPQNADCTPSIVTCAPLYWLDPNLNIPVMPASFPAGMESCAGMTTCAATGLPTGSGVNKSVMLVARPDMFTDCCGVFGMMEICCSTVSSTMFVPFISGNGAVFGCATSGTWCVGTDTEGFSYLKSSSTNSSQMNVYESRYVTSGNTLTSYVNNSLLLTSTPTTPNTGKQVRAGLAGDRSTAPIYFYAGLITADAGDHTAAYNSLANYYAGLSPSPLAGPLDVAFYVNGGFPDASSGYKSALIGNARAGYSGRCLSASYTGPVVDLTDEVTSATNTYACINGALDPAAATFCATNGCYASGLYVQAAWSPDGGNVSNVYDPLLKLTCSGGFTTCPTVSFSGSANALNNQPTLHFSGGQCLMSGTMSGYVAHVLSAWEIGAVMRRTSGTTYGAGIEWGANSYYFVGAGNSANTAAFSNGQAFGSGTASDGHWHSVIADTTTNSTGTLYVDGVSVGTASTNAGEVLQSYVTVGCGWNGTSITNPLNGDIAEVWMQHRTTNASGSLTSRVATIFANDKVFWGTLPN